MVIRALIDVKKIIFLKIAGDEVMKWHIRDEVQFLKTCCLSMYIFMKIVLRRKWTPGNFPKLSEQLFSRKILQDFCLCH